MEEDNSNSFGLLGKLGTVEASISFPPETYYLVVFIFILFVVVPRFLQK